MSNYCSMLIERLIAIWENGDGETPLHEFLFMTKRQLSNYQEYGFIPRKVSKQFTEGGE